MAAAFFYSLEELKAVLVRKWKGRLHNMTKRKTAEELLRETFGHTAPMQPDQRLSDPETLPERPVATKTTKSPSTPTLQEQLSEIDWDKADELDAQEDAPPMMDAEWEPPPSAPEQQPRAWTREEMLAAGIPEPLHPVVGFYDSLEEAKEMLLASGAKLNP